MTKPTGNPVGRPLGKAHDIKTRERIQVSQILNRLQKHINGELEKPMSASQVNAARLLLDKSLPSLQASTVDMTIQDDNADAMSDAELQSIAASGLRSVK